MRFIIYIDSFILHRSQQQAGPVSSAFIVEPTLLDPINVSTTSTRCSDINMLTIPKQQPPKRELPSVFEGNKREPSQGLQLHSRTGQPNYKSTCHSRITLSHNSWTTSRRRQYLSWTKNASSTS
eukprot:4143912-Amphidinium_carterae.1